MTAPEAARAQVNSISFFIALLTGCSRKTYDERAFWFDGVSSPEV
jgi:hypothetical protein